MAFVHGTKSRIFMNGRALSCEVKGFSTSWDSNLAEVTALCDGGSKFIPGMSEGSIQLEGYFQSDQGATGEDFIHEVISNSLDTDDGAVISAYPAGLTAGYPAFIQKGDTSSYEIESAVDDAVTLKMESQSDNSADWGVLLVNVTNDAGPAPVNSTGVQDVSAATTNGGAAILHVTSLTGTTPSATLKVQHSVDNTTFTDLATFSAATVIGGQFVIVPRGTTVNKYLRVQLSALSAGATVSYVVAFARR